MCSETSFTKPPSFMKEFSNVNSDILFMLTLFTFLLHLLSESFYTLEEVTKPEKRFGEADIHRPNQKSAFNYCRTPWTAGPRS